MHYSVLITPTHAWHVVKGHGALAVTDYGFVQDFEDCLIHEADFHVLCRMLFSVPKEADLGLGRESLEAISSVKGSGTCPFAPRTTPFACVLPMGLNE